MQEFEILVNMLNKSLAVQLDSSSLVSQNSRTSKYFNFFGEIGLRLSDKLLYSALFSLYIKFLMEITRQGNLKLFAILGRKLRSQIEF